MADQLVAINAYEDEEDNQSLPDDLTNTEEYKHELWKLGITESKGDVLPLNNCNAELEKLFSGSTSSCD